jgi:hypothetical protein
MHNPKNFTSGIKSISIFHNKKHGLKGGFERQRWNDIATVLVVFIIRSFLRNQISSSFMTKDNLVYRASSLPSMTKTFVSSVYRINFTPWIFNGRSLIYIKNKRGPRMEPCGTPRVITLDEDWNLCWVCLLLSIWDISTNCVQFVKYDWNHLSQTL